MFITKKRHNQEIVAERNNHRHELSGLHRRHERDLVEARAEVDQIVEQHTRVGISRMPDSSRHFRT
jgi:hypothetical protein